MEFPPYSKGRLVGIHDDGHRIYEWEPMVRTVCIGPRSGGKFASKKKYVLAWPYVQIIFKKWKGWDNYWSLHVSISNEPVEDIQGVVWFPPFLNVYHPTHQICVNKWNWKGELTDGEIMTQFWLSEFHDNGSESYWKCYEYLKNLPMESLEGWEEMSKEDPSFVFDVEWPDKTTIPDILHNKGRQDYTCFQMQMN